MPPDQSLIVVTGLPRSGTSMVMQMLAAGGIEIVTDHLRAADEDNPRGYFEAEAVKRLGQDSAWLAEARGKAVKIVAPLLNAIPERLPCRVIMIERDLDEVLDSQRRMLERRGVALPDTPERRRLLRGEFERMIADAKATLRARAGTELLIVQHRDAIAHPLALASQISRFLGGSPDDARMAAAIDPSLHRNRALS